MPGVHGQAQWAVGPLNKGDHRDMKLLQKRAGHTRDQVAAVLPQGSAAGHRGNMPAKPPPACLILSEGISMAELI